MEAIGIVWSAHKLLIAVRSAALLLGASSPTSDYREGQVWEYHTREGDKGSLLKIQEIESPSDVAKFGSIYHISIIGLHFNDANLEGVLAHAPFSKGALDASVTKLSTSTASFPDANEGIAHWRKANGGVFTIPVADAVNFVERTLQQ